MITNATMERVLAQYEKIIDRQQVEIDDLRNRLAAKTYGEYAVTRVREEEEGMTYPPQPVYEPGTVINGYPER